MSVLLFSSCSKSIGNDTESPVIKELKVTDANDENRIGFLPESNIKFSAKFTDNQELASYQFDVHFAGDGHNHILPVELNKKAINLVDWGFTKSGSVNGTEEIVTFMKEVDAEAKAGPYHCVVYATDEEGNAAEFKMASFIVEREDMPSFVVTNPDFSMFQVNAGGSFQLEGEVSAEKGLSILRYIVRAADDNYQYNIFDYEVPQDEEIDVVFSEKIEIPEGTPAGSYVLLILAGDKAGSVGQHIETFKVN